MDADVGDFEASAGVFQGFARGVEFEYGTGRAGVVSALDDFAQRGGDGDAADFVVFGAVFAAGDGEPIGADVFPLDAAELGNAQAGPGKKLDHVGGFLGVGFFHAPDLADDAGEVGAGGEGGFFLAFTRHAFERAGIDG